MPSNEEIASYVKSRFQNMESAAANMQSIWQDVANFCAPSQSNIQKITNPTVETISGNLYDDTATQSVNMFAAGSMAYLFPTSDVWFGFSAPHAVADDDDIGRWYTKCGEILRFELATSNFYSEVHETLRTVAWAGTAGLYVGTNKRGNLYFDNWTPGQFFIAEDDFHDIDTVGRCIKLSHRQAEMRFGRDNLSERVRAILDSGIPSNLDEEAEYIHLIFPRPDKWIQKRKGGTGPQDKPIASIYIEKSSTHLCQNGGYEEMPVVCARADRMNDTIYGRSMAMDCLPVIRSSNTQEALLDAMAEKAAFPPILIPDSMDGVADLTPGGLTIYDSNNPAALPQAWADGGRYDIGKDRAVDTKERIKKAFFNDVFQVFMDSTKRMATYEAMQLAAEKFALAHPMFSRFNTSMTKQLLERCFAICLRMGKFPPPPESLALAKENYPALDLNPVINFQSKAALALQQMANRSMDAFLDKVMYLSQVNQTVTDVVDFDRVIKDYGDNLNVPSNIRRPDKDVKKLREEREQQMQMQQGMAAIQQGAAAAKDAAAAGIQTN